MRIAIFSDTYPPQINGVATSTYNLVNTLKDHGNDVLLVIPNMNESKFDFIDDTIMIPGFVLKKLYGYRGTWIFNTKAYQIIKEFQPDVIHVQTDAPIAFFGRIVAKRMNIPVVHTYHTQYEDYTYLVTHGYFDRIAKKTIRAYSVSLAKNSAQFITPSIKTKEMLRRYGSDDFINVVPTGIDFTLFKKESLNKKEFEKIKNKLNIDDDTFTFLILGRLAKEKSMDVSIDGFCAFCNKYPNIKTKMIIVGGGPFEDNLKEQVTRLHLDDRVVFVGPVLAPMVPYYYHLADIYTSASITETQGLTFMEAMASGAIVLARFDDNLTGTIEDNDTGFFFTDLNSFVEKSYKIYSMNEKEKQLIQNNAYRIIEQYSIETFYNNIMEVYYRAIKSLW